MPERVRKAEELAIHPFLEELLAELQQENAHRSEMRVIKSESIGYSRAGVVPYSLCGDAVTYVFLFSSETWIA